MAPYKNFWTKISKIDNYVNSESLIFFIELLLFFFGLFLLFRFSRKKIRRDLYLGLFLIFLAITTEFTKYDTVNYIMEGNGYRLGDMIKDERFRSQINGRNFHFKFYPNSITSEYMRKTKNNNDYKTLLEIIDSRKVNEPPEKDEIVIHLRTGDEINKDPRDIEEIINSTYEENQYVRTLDFYKSLSLPGETKKVTIVSSVTSGGDTRSGDDFSKSYKYIELISNLFEDKGYEVQKRLNGDPDEDFIFMCNSKNFIPSYGGYSKLIKELVKLKKNKVLE